MPALVARDHAVSVRRLAAVGQVVDAAESLAAADLDGPRGVLRGQARATSARTGRLTGRADELLDSRAAALTLHVISVAAAPGTLAGARDRRVRTTTADVSVASAGPSSRRNPFGRDGSDQMQQVIALHDAVSALVPDPERADELFLRAVDAQVDSVDVPVSPPKRLVAATRRPRRRPLSGRRRRGIAGRRGAVGDEAPRAGSLTRGDRRHSADRAPGAHGAPRPNRPTPGARPPAPLSRSPADLALRRARVHPAGRRRTDGGRADAGHDGHDGYDAARSMLLTTRPGPRHPDLQPVMVSEVLPVGTTAPTGRHQPAHVEEEGEAA